MRGYVFLLLLSASVLAHAGEEAPQAASPSGRWTRPGPIPITEKTTDLRLHVRQLVEVGEIVEIQGRVKVLRPGPDGEDEEAFLRVGDDIYVNDRIEVETGAAAEAIFGINARLRLGPESQMRILRKTEFGKATDRMKMTRRDVELQGGDAHVRVRHNELTPTPVVLLAGDAQVVLDRTQAVVRREAKKHTSTFMVLSGKADVLVEQISPGGRKTPVMTTVEASHKLALPDGSSEEMPEPEPMTDEDRELIYGPLNFSVDLETQQRPPPPEVNRDLDLP